MKKLFLIAALAGLMAACNSNARRQIANQADETNTVQNYRNISATYKGTLPTASGSGMEVTIVLSGNDDYKKSYSYVDEDGISYENSGKFVWDTTGTVITLKGEELPNQYLVGNDRLTQLDTEGNRITGDLADNYILRKVP